MSTYNNTHETSMENDVDEKSNDEALDGPIFYQQLKISDGESNDEPEYFSGLKLVIIMLTINLSTFISSLDLGIVATAIPAITRDFHTLNDIAWYSSTMFIMVGSFSAMWGKLFTYFPAHFVYMSALGLFLVGSIVAASAPNSNALIVGRAIQGWGCSGNLGGSVNIINFTAAPSKRPLMVGIWMGVFMGCTVLGPLLGGVFTTEVTWRWCFWINLPIGGLALVLQVFFLRVPKHIKPVKAPWLEILRQLDLSGFVLLCASLISYVLSLSWGGLSRPWSSGSVIATLVVWVVLTIAFGANQGIVGRYAMLPFHLLKPRMTWINCLYAFVANCANFQILFYLPVYFQSVRGYSAIKSGVNTLPYVCFYGIGALVSGAMIGKTRLLQPLELVSVLGALVGAVLLYEMDLNTSVAWYVGAQVVFGFFIGLGNQVPVTALQAFAKPEEVATTVGMVFTAQCSSGAYFNTAAQSLFENTIYRNLAKTAPNISGARISEAGAAGLSQTFSGKELAALLNAYLQGVRNVFIFAIAGCAAAVILAALIPPLRLPADDGKGGEKEGKAGVEGEKDVEAEQTVA